MTTRVLHLIGDALPGGSNLLVMHWVNASLGTQCQFTVLDLEAAKPRLHDLRPDLILSHYPCSWSYLRELIAFKRHCPIWIYEHHYCEGFVAHQVRSSVRFYLMLRMAYGLVDKVIAVSEAQRSWMLQHKLVHPAKVQVISPATPAVEFFQVPPKPIGTPLIVGAYGRFAPQKGFEQLLAAFAHLEPTQFQLKLGGYGPEHDRLQQLAAGLPHVTFMGRIENLPQFLEHCDVIAIPSQWEPWGLVCLEAKMAGKPIIAAAVDGLVEQVQGCGLLVQGRASGAVQDLTQRPGLSWKDCIQTLPEQPLEAWSRSGRTSVVNAWQSFLQQWDTLLLSRS